jgi:hypothetical protein
MKGKMKRLRPMRAKGVNERQGQPMREQSEERVEEKQVHARCGGRWRFQPTLDMSASFRRGSAEPHRLLRAAWRRHCRVYPIYTDETTTAQDGGV